MNVNVNEIVPGLIINGKKITIWEEALFGLKIQGKRLIKETEELNKRITIIEQKIKELTQNGQ